eukprot:TRINITY_DN17129_c0_g1_i1.p1 TRINITY_DN17129_c0_g1~~TRINITY_DN17129_c0_g1_i1.p1  ORF type:complete len:428 (-),score=106.22 TRINITY_DN17129_c0_g1_i1:59-1207(-)
MEMLADSGVDLVRMDLVWSSTEQQQGVYDFSAWDVLMENLAAHNMRAVFILDYGNPLYDGGLSPYTDEGRQAFAKWALAAVSHFQGRGVFWEMWNEPNGKNFWSPAPNVTGYVLLAQTVGSAIKSNFPDEFFMGPAVADTKLELFDWDYLQACFDGGLLNYFDAVSVHPYRATIPETVARPFKKLADMISASAPAEKHVPIVSGEWGYTGYLEGTDIELGVEMQGKYLPRMLLTNWVNGILFSIWYDWHDDCTDKFNAECHFGLVFNSYYNNQSQCYKPKPAYLAAQTLTSLLKGFEFSSILYNSTEDHVLLFSNGEQQSRIVAWTARTANLNLTRTAAVPASGCFSQTDYLGTVLPSELCTDKDGNLTIPLTNAPLYLVPV